MRTRPAKARATAIHCGAREDLEGGSLRRLPAQVVALEALDLRDDERVESAIRSGRGIRDRARGLFAERGAVHAFARRGPSLRGQVREHHALLQDAAIL